MKSLFDGFVALIDCEVSMGLRFLSFLVVSSAFNHEQYFSVSHIVAGKSRDSGRDGRKSIMLQYLIKACRKPAKVHTHRRRVSFKACGSNCADFY